MVRGVVDHQVDRLAGELAVDDLCHRGAIVLRHAEMQLHLVADPMPFDDLADRRVAIASPCGILAGQIGRRVVEDVERHHPLRIGRQPVE
jgi:hypothetical protein